MYQMTETEYKFAELIWEEEPIGSGSRRMFLLMNGDDTKAEI